MKTKTFIVEIVLDERVPEADQELEARGRLMAVSGVKSVQEAILPSGGQ